MAIDRIQIARFENMRWLHAARIAFSPTPGKPAKLMLWIRALRSIILPNKKFDAADKTIRFISWLVNRRKDGGDLSIHTHIMISEAEDFKFQSALFILPLDFC
jgi:hypothetical protein